MLNREMYLVRRTKRVLEDFFFLSCYMDNKFNLFTITYLFIKLSFTFIRHSIDFENRNSHLQKYSDFLFYDDLSLFTSEQVKNENVKQKQKQSFTRATGESFFTF